MARIADKERARSLRAQGKSYSEIKRVLNVSKSTLSGWLNDMPLSRDRINQLRAQSPRRIEKFRETMSAKREARLRTIYQKANKDIRSLSKRDLFIAGLYLYWGEGLKAKRGTVGISNTDPAVLLAFLAWITPLGISRSQIRVKLHLYSDMDVSHKTKLWSGILTIPALQFRKPYIKTSKLSSLTYKTGFGHGTCNVYFENMAMWEYITMALKYIRKQHMRP